MFPLDKKHGALFDNDGLDVLGRERLVCDPNVTRRAHLDRDNLYFCCSPRGLDLSPLRRGLWIARIIQQADEFCAGHEFASKFELLCRQSFYVGSYSRHIASGPGIVCDQAKFNRISECGNHDRNGCCDLSYRNGHGTCRRYDDLWIELNYLGGNRWQPIRMAIRVSVREIEIPTFCVTELPHAFEKCLNKSGA